jgi:predicted NACHT family NTPase
MDGLTEAAAKRLIEDTTANFLSRTESIWGKKLDAFVEGFRNGVNTYLENAQARFSWTKTFLHRDPVYFYDIYFPLRLSQGRASRSTNSYKEVFELGSRVAIIGKAGSGKSTLMRHLFLNVIAKGEFEIPLFLELRRITPEQSLREYIEKHVFGSKLVLSRNALEGMLTDGKLILFLDGFDEIPAECLASAIRAIDDIATNFPKAQMVITGRPGSRVESLQCFVCAEMAELTDMEIRKFISVQKLGLETEAKLEKIIKNIAEKRKLYLREYLSNPLLLSLFILTCNTTKQLPDRKSAFYRRVVDTLFVEHDSLSKPDYDRRLRSGLSQSKFENLLQKFSAIAFFNSQFVFEVDSLRIIFNQIFTTTPELEADAEKIARDLVVGVGLWADDSGQYSFSHRSLQEYFAAGFVASLETKKKQQLYTKS